VLATAVFGRPDVREFGQKPGSGKNLGYGPAWVLRYNGSAWRQVSAPGTPVVVSAVSANDMWAFGPSAKTVNDARQVIIARYAGMAADGHGGLWLTGFGTPSSASYIVGFHGGRFTQQAPPRPARE